jgi:hypothetical protein
VTRYGTLRTWAGVLKIIGVIYVILALFGTIGLAIDVEGFWKTIGVIFIGIPVALFLATLPIALGQMMTAIADMGDAVVRE